MMDIGRGDREDAPPTTVAEREFDC